MTAKKYGPTAPDGSMYIVSTDGSGSLLVIPAITGSGSGKKAGLVAPDGSRYAVLTDGSGNLV